MPPQFPRAPLHRAGAHQRRAVPARRDEPFGPGQRALGRVPVEENRRGLLRPAHAEQEVGGGLSPRHLRAGIHPCPGNEPCILRPGSHAERLPGSSRQAHGRGTFNAAFQKIGRLDGAPEGEELFLGTFLSNDPYNEKLVLLDRTILWVSLAGRVSHAGPEPLFFRATSPTPSTSFWPPWGGSATGCWTCGCAPGGYEIGRLFASFNDMARELAQNRAAMHGALQESMLLKEYNEQIVNSIKAGIAIVNRDLVVEKANSAFLEPSPARDAPLLAAPLDLAGHRHHRRADGGKDLRRVPQGPHVPLRGQEGGQREGLRDQALPFYSSQGELREASGCVFMAEDVSAKTELEHKIFQAEKLATISMLSAGMAHEINNPLGSILTNVQNLIDEESSDERQRLPEMDRGGDAAHRAHRAGAAELFRQRRGPRRGSDVNQVVREVIALVSRSLASEERIRIDARLAAGLPYAVVSTDELKQVVINLLKNSVQAIEGPGRILLVTRRSRGSGRMSCPLPIPGSGIPKQVMPRIFDPFFTTKANGEGTGLGLSVVYGIVDQVQRDHRREEQGGGGTRFSLDLPCLDGGAGARGGGGA